VLYSLEPHVVLELHGDGIGDGATSLVAATSNAVFARRPHLAAAALHGGAAPLLIASAGGTPFYYAAVFHAKDRRLAYTNYAYTFEPRPPFRVLSVGRRPIRLRGERVRFVSGLARLGHFEEGDPLLGLSYGVDDRARCPLAHGPPAHRPTPRSAYPQPLPYSCPQLCRLPPYSSTCPSQPPVAWRCCRSPCASPTSTT